MVLVAALLVACSPTFNWREVPVGPGGLVALLPCKPDRAVRQLPLGTETVSVDMAGCEAGGATFAVAHAATDGPTQAEAWLRAWRAATRQQLGKIPAAETPASLPRSAASPAPVRLETRQGPDAGPADALHVLWFAQQRPGGAYSIYQATVAGNPSSSEALQTFFEGMRLP